MAEENEKLVSSDQEKEIHPTQKAEGKVEHYRQLAETIAAGGQVVPPRLLTGHARRMHVRSTLREDHASRIESRSPGAANKFDILSQDYFKFFRGTARRRWWPA